MLKKLSSYKRRGIGFLLLFGITLGAQSQVTTLLSTEEQRSFVDQLDYVIYRFEELIETPEDVRELEVFLDLYKDEGIKVFSPLDSTLFDGNKPVCLNEVEISQYYLSNLNLYFDRKLVFKGFNIDQGNALKAERIKKTNDGYQTYLNYRWKCTFKIGKTEYESEFKGLISIDFDLQNNRAVDVKISGITILDLEYDALSTPKTTDFLIEIHSTQPRPTLAEESNDFIIDGAEPMNSITLSASVRRATKIPFNSDKFSVTSGLGLFYHSGGLNVSSYRAAYEALDPENERYMRNVIGEDISESYSFLSLQAPIGIRYDILSNKDKKDQKLSLNAELALVPSYLVYDAIQGQGTFTFTGFYAQYNALLEDIEEYEFFDNETYTGPVDSPFEGFQLFGEARIQAGYPIKNTRWRLTLSASYLWQIYLPLNGFPENHFLSTTRAEYNGISPLIQEFSFDSFRVGISANLTLNRRKLNVKYNCNE